MTFSIRWRIMVPFVLLILISMSGLGIYISSFVQQSYFSNLETNLLAQARLLAGNSLTSLNAGSPASTPDQLAKHWASLLGARVTILSAEGVVIGESHEDRSEMENHLNRPEIQQAALTGQGSSTRFSRTINADMLYTAVPVTTNNETIGYVRIALPLEQVQADVAHLQRTLLLTTLSVAAAAVVLATWITNRTTHPIRELTAAAVRIANGEIQGQVIPTTTDEVGKLTHAFNMMSVQLRSQIQSLESERHKSAAVLQQMTDGVVILDSHGRVQLINPAAESMFEVNAARSTGRSLVEVFRNHQLVELYEQTQRTGETQSAFLDIGTKGLYVQAVAATLGVPLPGNTLLLLQNLTRIRHLETVRRDFISNISHELRTPLASLKALTETLQESALDDPELAQRFLQHIETEVDSLNLMVSELLELSRIESGRVPLRLEPVLPADLLKQVVERLQIQVQRAGLKIDVECQGELPYILADQKRLEQAAVNLIHNAIKFTPPGGEIFVRAQGGPGSVLFSVRDTGVGIPPADLPRVFERFYKSDRARSGGGTGLGLAIARHTVEAHRGKIWVESVEGKGSTFYFQIPLNH